MHTGPWAKKGEVQPPLPPPLPTFGGHTLDVEIPLSEDIMVAKLVLRGALIGEVMMGTLSLEKARQLVSSLSL
jgi:hypothetical protein